MYPTTRSPEEMMDLILETAKEDPRIRAAILNGSRVNPNATPDIFQDYDVVYIMSDFDSFLADPSWIDRFGERMILQTPDDMPAPAPAGYDKYAYLMQFMDGNRIDLTLIPIERLSEYRLESLSRLLMDKEGCIPPLPAANEEDYLPAPPSEKAYLDCCNEFWWVCPYVAKGLWREEIIYAKHTFDIVHQQLMKMLVWHVGIRTDFRVNLGSHNKRLQTYLEPELWQLMKATYADSSLENMWNALLTTTSLFRRVAHHVADRTGYAYPAEDDARVSAHLEHVRALPRDAASLY